MVITSLKNKLLLGAIGISMVMVLASMVAVSWMIDQQYLQHSTTLLRSASNVIEADLKKRKLDMLAASRQLAMQKNLGSTIWYLGQYAQSNLDRTTLLNTYQQLTQDTWKIGRVAKVSSVAIYGGNGQLVTFALFARGAERAGYVERFQKPVFKIVPLKSGGELEGKYLPQSMEAVPGIEPMLGGKMPGQDGVDYAVVNGLVAIESRVPIIGEIFDARNGKPKKVRVGLVVMHQFIDEAVVNYYSGLTDAKVNIFTPQGFSVGNMAAYRQPDWSGITKGTALPASTAFNEITEEGKGYYQSLIPLDAGTQRVGTIAAMYSKQVVRKNTLQMIQTLGLIGAVSLALILLFAWYFATTISQPLTIISRIFRSVADNKDAAILSGEFNQLKEEKIRHDELGDLTQSFIAMSDAVNQKIQQINEINASLEQKVRERTDALMASEQESRTMIENTPDTIARYDRDCIRTYANPAFASMAPGGTAELLGKRPTEYPGGPNAEIYEAMIKEVFLTGENSQFELRWEGKEGKEMCSHIRLTGERDLSGNVVSVLAVGRDISELNAYRNELKRRETEKSRFLAAAGHDMRQPLAAANLFVDALNSTSLDPEQAKIVQRLELAMSTFNGLLDSLLNISKLDAGIITPEYASIGVAELIHWLEQSFSQVAASKGLEFRWHLPVNSSLRIVSDIGLVKSVLMNLVTNAIKFTAHGAVMVSARPRNGGVLFQVWDTGMGIDPEQLKHIFDEFYQVNNPQRDRSSGLGLGLSIAKRSITLLGGEITCRSRSSRGSVFGFTLPLETIPEADARPVATRTVQDSLPDAAHIKGKLFVVVEDDMLVAQAMADWLEGLGGIVCCYSSAEDALNLADAGADYYIADHMLGGTLNGIQFLNRLREKLGKPVKAVLVTGDTSPAFMQEAKNCIWPVYYKPVSMPGLISSLAG